MAQALGAFECYRAGMNRGMGIRFSVSDNLDDALISRLAPYPVEEMYGKARDQASGGGRLSFLLAGVTRKKFASHVALAQKSGIAYNYLLNAACLDNREITRSGQKKIRNTLDWISSLGIRRVTVANVLLLKLIKRCYPGIQVRISVFAGVDSVPKARMWEEFGADCITLDSLGVNREFHVLSAIRKAVKIDLQLLVNNSCHMFCALSPGHMTFLAHGSQKGHHTGGFAPDYCFLYCSRMKLADPVNYIRSDWVRPEDLKRYCEMGYTNFKITERGAPTSILALRVKAYHEQRYQGNLLDLVQPFAYPADKNKKTRNPLSLARVFWSGFRPTKVNPFKLAVLGKLAFRRNMLTPLKGRPPVVLENSSLDGFLDRFETKGCRDVDCEECGYCQKWADKAVKIDGTYRKECLKLYEQAVEQFEDGSLWRYF